MVKIQTLRVQGLIREILIESNGESNRGTNRESDRKSNKDFNRDSLLESDSLRVLGRDALTLERECLQKKCAWNSECLH